MTTLTKKQLHENIERLVHKANTLMPDWTSIRVNCDGYVDAFNCPVALSKVHGAWSKQTTDTYGTFAKLGWIDLAGLDWRTFVVFPSTLTKKQRKQLKKVNKFIESTPLPNLVHKVLMKLGERDGYVYPSEEHQLLDGWDDLKTNARDVYEYGASGGTYSNFIYHADTTPFVENNRRDIKTLLETYYDDINNAYEQMVDWNEMSNISATCCEIQGAFWYADKEIDVYHLILEVIAHHVVEEVSRWYVDYKESN